MAADGTLTLTRVLQNTSLGAQERGGPRWAHDGAHGTIYASVSEVTNEFVGWPFSGTALGTRVDNNISAGGWFDINPAGNRVAIQQFGAANFFIVYVLNANGTLGSSLATSGTVHTTMNKIKWSPDGAYIGVVDSTTAGLSVYPWVADALGTRIIVPGTPGAMQDLDWNNAGTKIAVARTTNGNRIAVYDFSGGVLSGMVEPASADSNSVLGVQFHPDETYIAASVDDSPFLHVYAWDGQSFGTQTSPVPTGAGTGAGWVSRWSPLGSFIIVAGIGGDGNKQIWGYSFDSATGAITSRVVPDVDISNLVLGIDVSDDAAYVASFDAAEDLTIWQTGWIIPTVPDAPGTVTLTIISRITCRPPVDIIASWTAPASDYPITSYTATISGVAPTSDPPHTSITTTNLSAIFGGLQSGGTYQVCVYATSSQGNGPTTCETITIT